MRRAFVKTITALAEADPLLMLLTADLGFAIFDEFEKRFPRQFLNVGVAEQNLIGTATGLALEGRTVFAYSIGNFPTLRCLEQIRSDACYHGANVKIVTSGGGFTYGSLGMSHHVTEDLGILRTLPGMTIVAPGDAWETEEATKALAHCKGTSYLRLEKTPGEGGREGEIFRLGKACRLREGRDLTLIGTGGILGEALGASRILSDEGIECRVVSMHTLKPLDEEEILSAAEETGGIFTVEEHSVFGGLGGAVAEVCLEKNVAPGVFYRIGVRDEFSFVAGSQEFLRTRYGLDRASIAGKVKQILRRPIPISGL